MILLVFQWVTTLQAIGMFIQINYVSKLYNYDLNL